MLSYAVIDLGVTPGFVTSNALAINNSGAVVGYESTDTGDFHAFLWQNGVMNDLGTLGGPDSVAYGVNDLGQVVGEASIAAADQSGFQPRHAFLWQNGVMTDLGTLGGSVSRAFGINNLGQVVGDAALPDEASHAFLWQNGVMTDLGSLPDVSISTATAVNDSGQLIGSADTNFPVLWQNGVATPLDLDGAISGFANDINDAGQVVGYTSTDFGFSTLSSATLWQNGQVTYLGSLDGADSYATGINNLGQVVGMSGGPFLWQDGVMTDLATQLAAGTDPVSVQSINDAGQIAGTSGNHAVLLAPVAALPALSISNVSVKEGNSGTAAAVFTISLSAASSFPVTVQYSTSDASANAGQDYQAASGTLTFAPGETSKTLPVNVYGDRLAEPNETFLVDLSDSFNARISSGEGVGTILDDEPRISIGDVSKLEGRQGQSTQFIFTITLSAAYDQPVTMSFRTVDGTAKASGRDYVAQSGTLTFNPGETSKTIIIVVNGDNKKEVNETFEVDLFANSPNSLFTKSRGIGTILNDD